MDHAELLVAEKNKQIDDLKAQVAVKDKEITDLKAGFDKKLKAVGDKYKDSVTKQAVAEEIHGRLKRIKILAWMAIGCAPLAGLAAGYNMYAGAVIGLFGAGAAVIFAKREVFAEIQRLGEKYNLK